MNLLYSGRPFYFDSLPPSDRFCPTDVQLILLYLSRKVNRQPLPPNDIIQVHFYAHHPDHLAEGYNPQGVNKWFYFTPRDSKYPNGLTSERDIGGGRGYWKRTGSDIEIKDDHKGRKIILGYKSPFVFYHGSHPQGVETNWIMHEFTLADHPPQPLIGDNDDNLMLDDCVLCIVYKKDSSERGSERSWDVPTNEFKLKLKL